MQKEEAKLVAKKNAQERLMLLLSSASGILALLAALLAVYSWAFLSGYNESPRVVFFAEVADGHRDSLKEARKEISTSISEIGIQNIPVETQQRLALAMAQIELVEQALTPKETQEKGLFFPKWSELVIGTAHAQVDVQRANAKEDFRQNLAMGLLLAITVFWVVCLCMYFFSKDEKKISFSANMIQTVLGFYIGVFTGLMGLTPPAA
jgi:4-amino-4-deoxy-L-arabinose transferase-like glycosyltransferase